MMTTAYFYIKKLMESHFNNGLKLKQVFLYINECKKSWLNLRLS